MARKIKFYCPGCGARMKAPTNWAGWKVRCSNCDKVFRVPTPEGKPVPAPSRGAEPPSHASPPSEAPAESTATSGAPEDSLEELTFPDDETNDDDLWSD